MKDRRSKYPFTGMAVGEIRPIDLELPSEVLTAGHNVMRAAVAAAALRLATAIRQRHFRRPERYTHSITHGPNGPIAHIRRYQ